MCASIFTLSLTHARRFESIAGGYVSPCISDCLRTACLAFRADKRGDQIRVMCPPLVEGLTIAARLQRLREPGVIIRNRIKALEVRLFRLLYALTNLQSNSHLSHIRINTVQWSPNSQINTTSASSRRSLPRASPLPVSLFGGAFPRIVSQVRIPLSMGSPTC